MRVQVVMPQLGESIVEGTIVQWHKKVGDKVEKDEELFTISTDKVDTGVPAPSAGVLVEVVADVDQTVSVGELVAVLDSAADAAAATPDEAPAEAAPTSAPAPASASAEPSSSSSPAPIADEGAPPMSPVAKKMLAEANIVDASAIAGSGVGGRVLKHDVEAFLAARDTASAPDAPTPKLAHPIAPEPQRTPTAAAVQQVAAPPILMRAREATPPSTKPSISRGTEAKPAPRVVEQRPPEPKFELALSQRGGKEQRGYTIQPHDGDRVEPMSRSRVAVAKNLTYARRTAAHCSTVWEADVTDLVDARKRLKHEYAKLSVHLTYTAFILAAAAHALQKYPVLNAATDGENIIYRKKINIGIASAWKDGLVVPAIRAASSLSLIGLARAVNDIQRRTEDGELRPNDLDQSTFTLTNTGVLGAKYGVPTLFPPQVGILSVGTIEKRVVVGKDDALRVRSMVNICLTFDHRVVDFNDADGFMKALVSYLETTEW